MGYSFDLVVFIPGVANSRDNDAHYETTSWARYHIHTTPRGAIVSLVRSEGSQKRTQTSNSTASHGDRPTKQNGALVVMLTQRYARFTAPLPSEPGKLSLAGRLLDRGITHHLDSEEITLIGEETCRSMPEIIRLF